MSHSVKGTHIYEMIKKHLQDNDFKFKSHDEDLAVSFTVQGEDLPQPTVIRVIDERELVRVDSPIPVNMPEDKRFEAAVAVAVANNSLLNGNFDFDMEDGSITYRVTQSYVGTDISEDTLTYIMGVVFLTTDEYNDKLFMLGKGMMSLEQFIEKVGGN